jgi:hypothetical protein
MGDSTWLESLRPGDEAVMDNGWEMTVYPVQKRTRSNVVVSGLTFSKATGRSVGARMSGVRILEATASARRQVNARRLAARLASVDWKKQDTSTLEAVAALVWPSDKEKQG